MGDTAEAERLYRILARADEVIESEYSLPRSGSPEVVRSEAPQEASLLWSSTVQGGRKRRGARPKCLGLLRSALFQGDRCGRGREPGRTASPAGSGGS